jgi:hypothetical protein
MLPPLYFVRIIVLAVLLETAGIDEEKGREIQDNKYSSIDRIIEIHTVFSHPH